MMYMIISLCFLSLFSSVHAFDDSESAASAMEKVAFAVYAKEYAGRSLNDVLGDFKGVKKVVTPEGISFEIPSIPQLHVEVKKTSAALKSRTGELNIPLTLHDEGSQELIKQD